MTKYKLYPILVFLLFLSSCEKPIGKYKYFTEEEKDFFAYEKGQKLEFLKHPTDDTIIFEVVEKEIYHDQYKAYGAIIPRYAHFCLIQLQTETFNLQLSFNNSNDELIKIYTTLEKDGEYHNGYDGSLYCDSINKINVIKLFSSDYTPKDSLIYSKNKGVEYFNVADDNEYYELIDSPPRL